MKVKYYCETKPREPMKHTKLLNTVNYCIR